MVCIEEGGLLCCLCCHFFRLKSYTHLCNICLCLGQSSTPANICDVFRMKLGITGQLTSNYLLNIVLHYISDVERMYYTADLSMT